MIYLKKFFGKTLVWLICSGVLYTAVKVIIYIEGVFYLQGLLNTLGIDYSFVRMDSYNFNIEGGFLFYNSFSPIFLYACMFFYFGASLLFIFSDIIYLVIEKTKAIAEKKEKKFKIALFAIAIVTIFLCVVIFSTYKGINKSYQKGINEALAIIKGQPSIMIENKGSEQKEVVNREIKLKTGEVIAGKLIGCSSSQCIIYSNNKVFTIEKDQIASLVSSFEHK